MRDAYIHQRDALMAQKEKNGLRVTVAEAAKANNAPEFNQFAQDTYEALKQQITQRLQNRNGLSESDLEGLNERDIKAALKTLSQRNPKFIDFGEHLRQAVLHETGLNGMKAIANEQILIENAP
jgi:hypothetical protein